MVGEDGASRLPCVRTLQMAVPDLVNLSALIEDAKCFALVRQDRWPQGVHCPACGSGIGARDARDASTTSRQNQTVVTTPGRRGRDGHSEAALGSGRARCVAVAGS